MTLKYSEGNYILERTCGPGCPCRFKDHYTHLNLQRNPKKDKKKYPSETDAPWRKLINVRGRAEHEAIIKDKEWCEELGLDQIYETMVYLKRWGSWLGE